MLLRRMNSRIHVVIRLQALVANLAASGERLKPTHCLRGAETETDTARPRRAEAESVRGRGKDEDGKNLPRCMPRAEAGPRGLHHCFNVPDSRTTATLCCTEPQPAVFRSCSECRTLRRVSFCRAPDDHHLSHSSSSCIGYRFVNGLTTSWPS